MRCIIIRMIDFNKGERQRKHVSLPEGMIKVIDTYRQQNRRSFSNQVEVLLNDQLTYLFQLEQRKGKRR